MTLVERLADLKGYTVVFVQSEEHSVVFWNGDRVFLRFREESGHLIEDGLWYAATKPESRERAQILASLVTYR